MAPPDCLLRREYDPRELLARHPPVLRHPHKKLVFALACPDGAAHHGRIVLTRWAAAALPDTLELAAREVVPVPGYFDYPRAGDGIWHVNFADPHLFFAYGSPLLAQDELQAAEHPLLGCLREALLSERQPALTEEAGAPTPVLVMGVERRCAIDTTHLYGNRFAAAPAEAVRAAVHVIEPPSRTNLIAIASQIGSGTYTRTQIATILVTAYTGFAAAVAETRRAWPETPTEVRTGFWGCGAFGGNRRAMALLQLLAARLAGVDRLVFHAADDAGLGAFHAAAAQLAALVAPGEPLGVLVDRIVGLEYAWGTSDGN